MSRLSGLRNRLISGWTQVVRALSSTEQADPADLYYSYRLLLDREPDETGLREHMRLIRSGTTPRALADGFLNSVEFQMRHGRSSIETVDTGRFTMYVDSEDQLVSAEIMRTKAYEPHVTAALTRELRPDSVFVDVGANMGWFSLTAAACAPQGRVFAVEPNANNVQLLYRSLVANDFANVRVLPYAVSDQPRLLRLHFARSNGYVSDVDDLGGYVSIVQAQPLDDLLRDESRVDVLKIDIEGHEPVALRGMTETLTRLRPVLLTEFHPAMISRHAAVEPIAYLEALSALGYSLAVLHSDGTTSPPLDPAGILREFDKVRRADVDMHLDLIGRPVDTAEPAA